MFNLNTYEIVILDKPESVRIVIAPYKRIAIRLYLEHLNKYTANLVVAKLDVSTITNKTGVL